MEIIVDDLLIPLVSIAIAELGDKTQISIVLLSSRTKKHLQFLFGIILAFLIVDGIAIVAGSWITTIIPHGILKLASGIIFIFFGLLLVAQKEDHEKNVKAIKNVFLTGFSLILLTEWGDKTQIAAALFATKYNAILVLLGTIIALAALSAIAIFFGKVISEKVNEKTINKTAGLLFIIVGILFFLT